MAIQNYFSGLPTVADPAAEDFLRQAKTYSGNREVLAALGQEDTQRKAGAGLLTTVLKGLSVPGNLIRAGIAEGMGRPTPELAATSGIDQFKKLLTGEIRVGAGDIEGLKVTPWDSGATKALKLGAAFAADVATDPISYVSAPTSISRKAVATILATKGGDVANIIRTVAPKKSEETLAKLFDETPLSRKAAVQKELADAGDGMPSYYAEGTAAKLVQDDTVRARVTDEAVGNYLAEGLLKGGRKEVLTRLETLTGDRVAALAAFKKLPEEVQGGIVVTGLLGKPLKRADGSFVRLTPGTGESLGKFGEVVNKGRLTASYVFNPLTRLSGRGGDTFADVKAVLKKGEDLTKLNRPRFVDYVRVRNELGRRQATEAALSNKALAIAGAASNAIAKYEPDTIERKAFETYLLRGFHEPLNDFTGVGPVEREAIDTARKLHQEIMKVRQEAIDAGVEVGISADPRFFISLMMTPETAAKTAKTSGQRYGKSEWSTAFGRDSFIEFISDPQLVAKFGYELPDNPGVVALNPIMVNKEMERIKDPRRFVEDPITIYTTYAKAMAASIANARFLKSLTESGIVFRDERVVRRLLSEKEARTFTAGIANLSPQILKEAQAAEERAKKDLANVIDYDSLQESQQKIAALRAEIKSRDVEAATTYATAKEQYRLAFADVVRLEPKAGALRQSLRKLRSDFIANDQNLTAAQRAARSIRAKVGRAQSQVDNKVAEQDSIIASLEAQRSTVATPEEAAMLDELIGIARTDADEAMTKLDELAGQKELVEQELQLARAERDRLINENAGAQQAQVNDYANAVVRMNEAEQAMIAARAERIKARRDWKSAEADISFEKVQNINTLVSDYSDKLLSYKQAEAAYRLGLAKLRSSKASEEVVNSYITVEGKKVADLKEAADIANSTIKEVLSYTSQKFEKVARAYATSLLKAVEDLTQDQFAALQVISSTRRMADYIEVTTSKARDSKEALDAVGDLYKTWESIRDTISPELFDTIAKTQADILRGTTVGRLIREEKVASKYGEALINDDLALEALNFTRATKDLYAERGVQSLFRSFSEAKADPTPFQKMLNDYVDPLLTLWKTAVTINRGPGYVATNTIGGMFMNYLGNVSARNSKLAGRAIKSVIVNLRKIEKANPNRSFAENLLRAEEATQKELGRVMINGTSLYDIMREFFTRGGFFDTETQFAMERVMREGIGSPLDAYKWAGVARSREWAEPPKSKFEEKFRNTVNFLMTNKIAKANTDMAQTSELYLRMAAFLDGFEKYGNYESALANVHILHFNYQDLSEAEEWVRRFVPFYTWTRNNVPAQLRAMVMQPGKIQRALYLNEEFQNTFGASGDESWYNQVLPEYLDVADGFATSFKNGDNNIGYMLRLPFEDINRLFQVQSGVVTPRKRELANMLGPFSIPIEIAAGVDLGTGQPFSEKGVSVPSYYKLFNWLPGAQVYTDAEGVTRANPGLAKFIQDVFPTVGVTERMVSGASAIPAAAGVTIPSWLVAQEQQTKSLTDFLNVTGIAPILGVSTTTLTPQSLRGELIRRGARQSADIGRLTAEAGVDPDWVREQVRMGKGQAEIAMLIAAGYGKPTENKRSNLKESTRQGYIKALGTL